MTAVTALKDMEQLRAGQDDRFDPAVSQPIVLPGGGYRESAAAKWPAALAALILNAGLLGLAIAHHYTAETKRAAALTVFDVIEAPPPPPPASRQEPELAVEKPQPIVAPRPRIVIPAPTPPPIEVTEKPSPSPPQTVVAAPEAPKQQVTGPVSADNLDATMTSAAPPRYPVESRRNREQGTVVLLVLVGEDGRVLDVSIRSSSGHERLDRAALAAVRRWRWSPRTVAGAPVQVRGLVQIPFVLREAGT